MNDKKIEIVMPDFATLAQAMVEGRYDGMLGHARIRVGQFSGMEDIDMAIEDIRRVDAYNDRAVVVTFGDGSRTRSVVQAGDSFDLDTGIAICLFKRALGREDGHRRFNDLMRRARRVMAEQQMAEEAARAEADRKREAERLRREKAQNRKAAARMERIDDQVTAIRQAMREMDHP